MLADGLLEPTEHAPRPGRGRARPRPAGAASPGRSRSPRRRGRRSRRATPRTSSARASGVRVTAVAHPQLRVLRRVLQLALHHPAVEPRLVEPCRRRAPRTARPRRCSQLPSSCAMPPGASTAPTSVTSLRTISSPGEPAVPVGVRRHGRRPRGDDERRVADDEVELLAAARARAGRPGAGRRRARRSARGSGGRRRARGRRRRWRRRRRRAGVACRACTPQPVPTSSTRATGVRIVHRASVTEAPPTPSTWSGRQRAAGGDLAQVGDDPPVGRAGARRRRRRAAGPPGRGRRPARPAPPARAAPSGRRPRRPAPAARRPAGGGARGARGRTPG